MKYNRNVVALSWLVAWHATCRRGALFHLLPSGALLSSSLRGGLPWALDYCQGIILPLRWQNPGPGQPTRRWSRWDPSGSQSVSVVALLLRHTGSSGTRCLLFPSDVPRGLFSRSPRMAPSTLVLTTFVWWPSTEPTPPLVAWCWCSPFAYSPPA